MAGQIQAEGPSGVLKVCFSRAFSGGGLILLALTFVCTQPLAAQAIGLPESTGLVRLGPRVEILEDPKGDMTLEQVRAAAVRKDAQPGSFSPSADEVPNFGFTSSVYWVRFQLINQSQWPQWLLHVGFPLIDRVDLFEEGGQAPRTQGMLLPFAKREVQNRNLVFRLNVSSGKSTTYYLRFQNEDSMQMPLTVYSPEKFQERDHHEQFGLGVYYGILVVMCLYNFFLFVMLRERGYLYYVVYITFFGLFLFSQYGLAYEYLWPMFNWGARRMNPTLAGLLEFSALLFARQFLDTRQNTPRLHRWTTVGLVLTPAASLGALFLPLRISATTVVFLGLGVSVTVILAGGLSLRAGFRPARYFMLAFAMLILGAILYALKTYGALPATFVTSYGMQIGSGIEVTLLALGLADKISILSREKSEAERQRVEDQLAALQRQKQVDDSYARMIPREFLSLLGKTDITSVRVGDQVQTEMSILFSDIRSFTELSETMTPKENFDFLNSYLRRMNPHIIGRGGYVDKYIGDGIMALFPGGADAAVLAAVDMRLELRAFNHDRRTHGYRPVEMGVGIHTGRLMLGTIGTAERMEVSVISDAVNLASRIEGLTKVYGTPILLSQVTWQSMTSPDRFLTRVIANVRVKGKKETVVVLEVLNAYEEQSLELLLRARRAFEQGVTAYFAGEMAESGARFQEALIIAPADPAARLYLDRCALTSGGDGAARSEP